MASSFLNKIGNLFTFEGDNEKFERLEGINIRNEGNSKRFKEIKRTLLLLPDGVLSLLKRRKVEIVYSNDKELFFDGEVKAAGFFIPEYNTIYVYDFGKNLKRQKSTLIHEIGHCVDYHMGIGSRRWLSDQSYLHLSSIEIQKYYQGKYGENGLHYLSNEKESFAQGFSEFFLDKQSFFNYCKKQYRYFEEVLRNVDYRFNF